MSRILVTGVAGFIGSHIAAALAQRGDFVLGIDRAPKADPPTPSRAALEATGNFRYQSDADLVFARHGDEAYLADMIPPDLIPELLPGGEWRGGFDFAVLCAGVNYWKHEDNDLATAYEQITDAGIGGLKLAAMLQCKHAAYMSSADVFGKGLPLNTESGSRRSKAYAASAHVSVEEFGRVWSAMYSRTFIPIRLPHVYGPRESKGSPVRVMFESLLAFAESADPLRTSEAIPVFIPGDPLRTLDPLHVSDVVSLTLAALDAILGDRYGFGNPNDALGNFPLNAGSHPGNPFALTSKELAFMVARALGGPIFDRKRLILDYINSIRDDGEFGRDWALSPFSYPENECLDATFARNNLEWFPKISPSEGIKDLADYYRKG